MARVNAEMQAVSRPTAAPSVLSQILGARNPLNAARTTVAPWLRGTEERVPSVLPGLLAGAIEKAPIFAPTVGEAIGKTGEAVIGPELLAAMKMMDANPEQMADLIPAMASSPLAYPMVASMGFMSDPAELAARASELTKQADDLRAKWQKSNLDEDYFRLKAVTDELNPILTRISEISEANLRAGTTPTADILSDFAESEKAGVPFGPNSEKKVMSLIKRGIKDDASGTIRGYLERQVAAQPNNFELAKVLRRWLEANGG